MKVYEFEVKKIFSETFGIAANSFKEAHEAIYEHIENGTIALDDLELRDTQVTYLLPESTEE